jgi:hypothetical protein
MLSIDTTIYVNVVSMYPIDATIDVNVVSISSIDVAINVNVALMLVNFAKHRHIR